jgi:hypothetical protein
MAANQLGEPDDKSSNDNVIKSSDQEEQVILPPIVASNKGSSSHKISNISAIRNSAGVTGLTSSHHFGGSFENLSVTLRDADSYLKTVVEQNRQEELKKVLLELKSSLTEARDTATDLTARVILPEDIAVQLVPSNLLEHLDEVRSDENKAYLFIGVFAGAEVGIVVNWATDDQFTITRPSLVLAALFGVLLLISAGWAWLLSRRGARLKSQLFEEKESR